MNRSHSIFHDFENLVRTSDQVGADPSSTAFVSLSEAYDRFGFRRDALQILREGIRRLPRHIPAYLLQGRLLEQQDELKEAAQSFESALELDPGNLTALKGLARVQYRLGNMTRTSELLERVLQLEPHDEPAKRLLQMLKARTPAPKSPSAAPPQRSPSPLKERDESPIATPTIAEIYLRQGLPRRALKVYQDLFRLNPDHPELQRKLTELEARIRAEEEQIKALEAEQASFVGAGPADDSAIGSSPIEEAGSKDQVALELLNRWLESIRRRKMHVQ